MLQEVPGPIPLHFVIISSSNAIGDETIHLLSKTPDSFIETTGLLSNHCTSLARYGLAGQVLLTQAGQLIASLNKTKIFIIRSLVITGLLSELCALLASYALAGQVLVTQAG